MYYNKENVERLRQRYPEGTRICLDRMNDDPFPVESGTLSPFYRRRAARRCWGRTFYPTSGGSPAFGCSYRRFCLDFCGCAGNEKRE